VLNVDGREDQSERREAEEWLRDYLADGPVGAGEAITAARRVGITKATLWRAANSIPIVRHKLGGRGAGWEWSLPDSKNPATQDSKNSPPGRENVNSLNSLTNHLKTKADGEGENSKNSAFEYMNPLNSLPLGDHASDDEEDGEIRL
jgi:hypothetical protein